MSTNPVSVTSDSMTKEARKKAICRFLNKTGLILPVGAIHANMRRRGFTFSYSTVRRHLNELEDEGRVKRLEEPRTFYELTDEGREWVESDPLT